MGLIDELGRGPVALDTAAFIYFIEAHPLFLPVLRPLFAAADRGELMIVTSEITLLEVLMLPYRAGNLAIAEQYEDILTRSRNVRLREIDRTLLRNAAQLRSVSSVRTPDALQLAAALAEGCSDFVTNDQKLRSLPGLNVLHIGEFA